MGQAHTLDNKVTQEHKQLKVERTFLYKECHFAGILERLPWVETRIMLHNCKIRIYQENILMKKINVDANFAIISDDFKDKTICFSYVVNNTQYRAMIQTNSAHDMLNLKTIIMRSKRPVWQKGSACQVCGIEFTIIRRKHHCRNCGKLICNDCSPTEIRLNHLGYDGKQRVCTHCQNPYVTESPFRSGRVITRQIEADTDFSHTPTFNNLTGMNFTFARN